MDDLDRWTKVLPLGTGGFGEVHLAWDTQSSEWVALKRFTGQDELGLLRFVIESRIRVSHPHLVRTLAFRLVDDRAWLVTQLARGGSVRALMSRTGALPWGWVAEAVDQILSALAALHSTGVIHRDLKPANLLLRDGGTVRPHLLVGDFGIATWRTVSMTGIGAAIGTPGYLAPEYLDGQQPAPATDLFAVGVLAAELLAGRRLVHYSNGTPDLPSSWSQELPLPPSVPAQLAAVLRRMADPDPRHRYKDCTEAREALLIAAPPESRTDLTSVTAPDILTALPTGWTIHGPEPTDETAAMGPGWHALPIDGGPTGHVGPDQPQPDDNPWLAPAAPPQALATPPGGAAYPQPAGGAPFPQPGSPNSPQPATPPGGSAQPGDAPFPQPGGSNFPQPANSAAHPGTPPAGAAYPQPAGGPNSPQPTPPNDAAAQPGDAAHPQPGSSNSPQPANSAAHPGTPPGSPNSPQPTPPGGSAAQSSGAAHPQPGSSNSPQPANSAAHPGTPPGSPNSPQPTPPGGSAAQPGDAAHPHPAGNPNSPQPATPPGGTPKSSPKPKPRKQKRRLKRAIVLTAVLLVAASAGAVWWTTNHRTISGQPSATGSVPGEEERRSRWEPTLVEPCSKADRGSIRETASGDERCQRTQTTDPQQHWVREPEGGFPRSNPSGPFVGEECQNDGDTDYTPVGDHLRCTDGAWQVIP